MKKNVYVMKLYGFKKIKGDEVPIYEVVSEQDMKK